jgi:hypothetical protein
MMKEHHDFKPLLNEMNKYIRDYIADGGSHIMNKGLDGGNQDSGIVLNIKEPANFYQTEGIKR